MILNRQKTVSTVSAHEAEHTLQVCIRRHLLFVLLFMIASVNASAQYGDEDSEEGEKKFFKKENLFTGGNVNVGFGNQFTALGVNPHFGYSINRFVDVAVSMGVNYISQRDFITIDDRVRQTVLSPGAFVRLFPVKFLFAQAHYEQNFITQTYIPSPGSSFLREKIKVDGPSLLVGGGYCTGRQDGGNSYFYFSVLWDVLKDGNSPYVDNIGRAIPQIRAGFNVALFQGKANKDNF